MHKARADAFRCGGGLFKRLVRHPRFYICLSLTALFCLREVIVLHDYLVSLGYSLHVDEMAFVIVFSGCNMPYTSVLFLLLLGDFFTDRSAMQADESVCVQGQILYCLYAALTMTGIVLSLSLLLSPPFSAAGTGWSEPLLFEQGLIQTSIVPKILFSRMTPIPAILLSALVIQLFWHTAAMAILVFTVFRAQLAGVMLYVFSLFASSICMLDRPLTLLPDMRFSLHAVLSIAPYGNEMTEVMPTLLGYAVALAALAAVLSRSRRSAIYPTDSHV